MTILQNRFVWIILGIFPFLFSFLANALGLIGNNLVVTLVLAVVFLFAWLFVGYAVGKAAGEKNQSMPALYSMNALAFLVFIVTIAWGLVIIFGTDQIVTVSPSGFADGIYFNGERNVFFSFIAHNFLVLPYFIVRTITDLLNFQNLVSSEFARRLIEYTIAYILIAISVSTGVRRGNYAKRGKGSGYN